MFDDCHYPNWKCGTIFWTWMSHKRGKLIFLHTVLALESIYHALTVYSPCKWMYFIASNIWWKNLDATASEISLLLSNTLDNRPLGQKSSIMAFFPVFRWNTTNINVVHFSAYSKWVEHRWVSHQTLGCNVRFFKDVIWMIRDPCNVVFP